MRVRLNLGTADSEFEKIFLELLVDCLPTCYVEGYTQMLQQSKHFFPRRATKIVSAGAHFTQESFKFWLATQVEQGAEFLAVQHGGHYGCGKWSSNEEHELKVADKYCTWGWNDTAAPNIIPIDAPKLRKLYRGIKSDPCGPIEWALMGLPRYAYWMYSIPVGPQFLDYVNDQGQFWRSLSGRVQQQLRLRLYPHDFGWGEEQFFARHCPGLYCYRGRGSMLELLSKRRLFVGTYNATTYLETLAANFPTVLFWNPAHWELRPESEPLFKRLSAVGILHNTPQAAAAHVDNIFDNVTAWWQDNSVQQVRAAFCEKYACITPQWRAHWKRTLSQAAAQRMTAYAVES